MEVREAKLNYKINLEKELSRNNLGSVWKGMTVITGYKGSETKIIQLPGYDSSSQLAEEINRFYLRFDAPEFGPKMEPMNYKMSCGGDYNIFDELDVIKHFKGCKKTTLGAFD